MAKQREPNQQLIPTCLVGQTVVWIRGGVEVGEPIDHDNTDPAICAAVEGPGRIGVWVFPSGGGQPFFKKSVRHCSSPDWAAMRHGDVQNGAWEYVKGFENTDKYEVHQAFLERQRQQREAADKKRAEVLAKQQARQQALEESKQQPV